MKNINLIRKIVWGFVKKNQGLEFDDLFSEACVAYLEVKNKYNPSKGAESTFIWHVVHNCLVDMVGGEMKKMEVESPAEMQDFEFCMDSRELSPEQVFFSKIRYEELMESLSPEALEICQILFDRDLYMDTDKPKLCRGIIMRELRNRGWGESSIWDAFREIKLAVAV